MNPKNSKGDKKQHIQVFTRVRPTNFKECKSPVILDVCNNKEVTVRDKAQKKTFSFDKVFGPNSSQIEVYKTVVQPYISEVLQGYNCTVFAYGQTGTGKTFTMIGEKTCDPNITWDQDPSAGIIPRTLSQLFDELKVRAEEFTVRISFLEIYNEELYDLLASNTNCEGKNIRLYEDTVKRGSVILSGLEERTVHNKSDVYDILENGMIKRQTASTLMNAQSSRSHTIFTITVHIKDTTPEGEELIKTGKLNLVDLAGSENIGRSGAVEMRAREAGNINQSLLTLGRVITSLVERTPHVPYRESKLTRILQDSLGGKTKTSIIATVSPTLVNMDETLSTLDYAHRAKNITNKPEINQKTSKRVLLKEYTEEIERLKRDLVATRDKHGVYLAAENYNQMVNEKDQLNKELVQKIECIKVMEDELLKKETIVSTLNMDLCTTRQDLEERQILLENLTSDLESTKTVLGTKMQELQETELRCEQFQTLLTNLTKQATAILKVAEEATADTRKLQDKIERTKKIEDMNKKSFSQFKTKFQTILGKTVDKVLLMKQNFMNGNSSEVKQLEIICGEVTDKLTGSVRRQCDDIRQKTEDVVTDQLKTLETILGVEKEIVETKCLDIEEKVTRKWLEDKQVFKIVTTNCKLIEKLVNENLTESMKQREIFDLMKKDEKMLEESICNLPHVLSDQLVAFSQLVAGMKEREKELLGELSEIEESDEIKLEKLMESVRELKENRKRSRDKLSELAGVRDKEQEQMDICFSKMRKCIETDFGVMSDNVVNIKEKHTKVSEGSEMIEMSCKEQILPALQLVTTNQHYVENEMDKIINFNQMTVGDIKSQSLSNTQAIHEMKNNLTDMSGVVNEKINTCLQVFELVDSIKCEINEYVVKNKQMANELDVKCVDVKNELMERIKETEYFFNCEVGHDEPTGATPQRKNFDYPKKLVVNSPRTQMLFKQRSAVELVNLPMDCDNADMDRTITNVLEDVTNTICSLDALNNSLS